eukprot:6818679-Ditylum_brightwellii.AAC.1
MSSPLATNAIHSSLAIPTPAAQLPQAPAAVVPAPTVSEDAVQDGGETIDTFSAYIPTALPDIILKTLHKEEHPNT